MKIILILILLNILNLLRADQACDFAECNHEGECYLKNNEKTCNCIGNKYFKGPTCSQAIDLCKATKPCKNYGKCQAVIGQFVCKECNKGFGGLLCNSEVPNAFTNLVVTFNHYGFYAKSHKFLIMAETLVVAFSVEFVSEHYVIDSWETKTFKGEDKIKWTYSNDLESVIRKYKIRYYNDLPYQKGYYHLASETFWDYGFLQLTLRSYDTETGTKLLYENIYDLLILKGTPQCIPQLKFVHGANPLEPLMVDIARYNNFEVNLKKRCFENSKNSYKWPQVVITQASCFILVLPKPIKAVIKGGSNRAIGYKQDLLIDGTESRDFALAPNVLQDMIYNWDCVSTDDPKNRNCKEKYGFLQLTLRSYDTETGTKLLYENIYDLLILKGTPQCIPQLKFVHGANPLEPLMVDIARYNNFEVNLKKRCFENSKISYKWPQVVITQASCFILVLPKPIKAVIKGGSNRAIGYKQDLLIDGTESRDFALAPNVLQDMIYNWDCVSTDDPKNRNCKEKYGFLQLTLRSYDTETGTKLLYENIYDLLILRGTPQCIPQLKFVHGANPLEPLMVDIARYNNFEVNLKKRCFENSKNSYKWPQVVITQASCFILVLPKPIKAVIKGGSNRAIGYKQDLLIDGTESRDFALAPNVLQDMIYNWDCVSTDDPKNRNCKEKIGSTSKLMIDRGALKINANYKFTLYIKSKVNKLISDQTSQLVQVVEQSQLLIYIQCIRNCIRQQFTNDNFIHLRVLLIKGTFSENVQYKWIFEEAMISQEQRLIYAPKEMEINLKFEVVVREGILQGKSIMELTKNLPPQNGSCSIDPLDGEAFVTEFHIKCQHYQDEDTPLNYQYMAAQFPLQRINDPEIYIKLPEINKLTLKICDQFQACTEIQLKVSVSALNLNKDIQSFVKERESKLSKLLEEGNVLSAMILMKSLVKYIKTNKDIWLMIKEIKNYNLKTLIDVEQFLDITKELFFHILPLNYKKSYIFVKYFQKFNKGFEAVFKDEEIKDLMKSSYDKLLNEFMDIMGEFSKSWESIPQVQLIESQIIQVSKPLAEYYDDLADFDVFTLKRIVNWLQTARALHNSFDFMALAAIELYYPLENPLVIQDQDKFLKVYALEKLEKQEISFKQDLIFVTLNKQVIRELKQQLHSSSVLLQIASVDSNPFWWYPDDEPLDTDVFYITAIGKKSIRPKTQVKLKHPIEFQLKLKNPVKTSLSEHIRGVLKNNLHMPLYYLEMNENSVLIVNFVYTEGPFKIKIGFNRNPFSFEVKQKGLKVHPDKLSKKYVFFNGKEEKVKASLALLLDDDDTAENVNFAFTTEVRECLYWDFQLSDPQWSSKGCKPKLLGLKCECYHLSAFAAKTYKRPMQKDLADRQLLSVIGP